VWNNLRLLTRSDLVIVVWEYGGVPWLYFLEREIAYFWGIERYAFRRMSVGTFGGWNVV
jgi:hypothetical protein